MIEQRGRQKGSGDTRFSAVVGQAELKEALLAVAANDDLDGLLVRGEKGTAKSTAVRGLADLLPEQRAVADCPYSCPPDQPEVQCRECQGRSDTPVERRQVPLVTLPLGATRERVVGTLSVADALAGDYEFEPGLLARANRGILYVDEVNLLEDHLVDVLLDAAASGVNRVERDAVSVTHPASFTLVGTMNPEEGELRPQLRDRFAIQATVTACEDIEDRVAIVDRALRGPETGGADDGAVRARLLAARDRLDAVTLGREYVEEIATLCRDAGVDGHRGDIATARTARTLAALDVRERVLADDVQRAAELALPHRLQSRPFEDAPDPEEVVDEHFDDDGDGDGAEGETESDDSGETEESDPGGNGSGEERGSGESGDPEHGGEPGSGESGEPEDGGERGPDGEDGTGGPSPGEGGTDSPGMGADASDSGPDREPSDDGADGDGEGDADGGEQEEGTPLVPGQPRAGVADVGESGAPELSAPEADGRSDASGGSRARDEPGVDGRGARVRTRRADSTAGVDAAASVRAAAGRGAASVESRDLRESVRAGDSGALVVFVVDASASMRPAMRAAKGTVLELLEDAYRGRDEVAFVAFAGEDAEVLLPPTDSVTLAARHLKDLPTGDRTPLPAGLDAASEVLDRADPAAGIVVLVSDGRANVAGNPVADTRTAARDLARRDPRVLVVDAGDGDRAALTDLVVEETDAQRVSLAALSADRVDAAAGRARETQL